MSLEELRRNHNIGTRLKRLRTILGIAEDNSSQQPLNVEFGSREREREIFWGRKSQNFLEKMILPDLMLTSDLFKLYKQGSLDDYSLSDYFISEELKRCRFEQY